ncbi:hypothetical protein SODG_000159 [Sodalis praecaptivus]|nr:hypothetical protein NVIRENTERO_03646 [Sodalis praecaptivus]
MFDNHAALLLALNYLTEKDKDSKEFYMRRVAKLYNEFDLALRSGDPEGYFGSPGPMSIHPETLASVSRRR